jgi:hypothetical protein
MLGHVVFAISVAVVIAWNVEAWTSGRGFVSTYLAPVAAAGLFVSMWLKRDRRPPSA